jgi:hypothetical protein
LMENVLLSILLWLYIRCDENAGWWLTNGENGFMTNKGLDLIM